MIVMRENERKANAVHPGNSSQGWLRRLSSIALASPGGMVTFTGINDLWLSFRLEAKALLVVCPFPTSIIITMPDSNNSTATLLVISSSVRPYWHGNQKRSQMLPRVIESENWRTRQACSPCSRVGS